MVIKFCVRNSAYGFSKGITTYLLGGGAGGGAALVFAVEDEAIKAEFPVLSFRFKRFRSRAESPTPSPRSPGDSGAESEGSYVSVLILGNLGGLVSLVLKAGDDALEVASPGVAGGESPRAVTLDFASADGGSTSMNPASV